MRSATTIAYRAIAELEYAEKIAADPKQFSRYHRGRAADDLEDAKSNLGWAYEDVVGYNPFLDDPSISIRVVAEALIEIIQLEAA